MALAFYIRPGSIDEIVDFGVCRVPGRLGIEVAEMKRWGEHIPAS